MRLSDEFSYIFSYLGKTAENLSIVNKIVKFILKEYSTNFVRFAVLLDLIRMRVGFSVAYISVYKFETE